MAINTSVPLRIVGGTTDNIMATAGVAKQLVYDTDKNCLVLMDGVTVGGHYVAMASIRIKAGSPNVRINGQAEATLSDGELTITTIPGTIPGSISLVENPEGVDAGQYLKFEYTNAEGNADHYLVNVTALVDIYTAGQGISISADKEISANFEGMLKPGGGLAAGENGLAYVNLADIVDTGPGSLLEIVDGKITLKSVVSSDADNILKAGTDNKAFLPGDLGSI